MEAHNLARNCLLCQETYISIRHPGGNHAQARVEHIRRNTIKGKYIGVAQLSPDQGFPAEILYLGYNVFSWAKFVYSLWPFFEPFGQGRWYEYEVPSKRLVHVYRYLDRHWQILPGKNNAPPAGLPR
jgi:hypothetical protein